MNSSRDIVIFSSLLACLLASRQVIADDDSTTEIVADFLAAPEGDLPEGWDGPDALAIQKDGDQAWLEASTAGMHELKSPTFSIDGDFELNMNIALMKGTSAQGSEVHLTLEAPNGESMLVSFEQASPGIGINQWEVSLGNSTKVIDAALEESVPVRLLRRGRVFRVLVDGDVVIARRMSQFSTFSQMRVGVSGPENSRGLRVSKVYSISLVTEG